MSNDPHREAEAFLAANPQVPGCLGFFFEAAFRYGGGVGFASRHESIDGMSDAEAGELEGVFRRLGECADDESVAAFLDSYFDSACVDGKYGPDGAYTGAYVAGVNLYELHASMVMRGQGEDV